MSIRFLTFKTIRDLTQAYGEMVWIVVGVPLGGSSIFGEYHVSVDKNGIPILVKFHVALVSSFVSCCEQ